MLGFCAKTAVYPFDTTKKRLQVVGFEKGRLEMGQTLPHKGMWACMTTTVKNEGLKGLYRGFLPGMIKAVATTSVNFWFYEYAISVLAIRHRRND